MKSMSLCSLQIFLTATMFFISELQNSVHSAHCTTRTGTQDQNQGRPRATRTHCGRMGQIASAHHRQSCWRVAKEKNPSDKKIPATKPPQPLSNFFKLFVCIVICYALS